MPLRTAAVLLSLLAAVVAVFALSWASGAEFYFFMPSRHLRMQPPPTNPLAIAGILIALLVVAIISRHYGILLFFAFPLGLILGSLVGLAFLNWTPSLGQHLLVATSLGAGIYAWLQREYLDY